MFRVAPRGEVTGEESERRHRIILAVIVFILLGTFTIIERFVFFYKDNLGITIGLAFAESVNPPWLAIATGIVVGVLLIVSGVFLGFYRIWLPVLLGIVLVLDLIMPITILLNSIVRTTLPLLVIIAIRIACLKWLAQGVMAVYHAQEIAKKQAADQKEIHQDLSEVDGDRQSADSDRPSEMKRVEPDTDKS